MLSLLFILLLLPLLPQYGQTALIFASFSGYSDIVEMLLRYKAKPDVQTKFGQTALMKVSGRWQQKSV